jgi:hypothetical protein
MDDRELLLTYLSDRDVACPECFYNLRDNTDARCPECGGMLGFRDRIVRVVRKPSRPPIRPGGRMHNLAVWGLGVPAIFFGSSFISYFQGDESGAVDTATAIFIIGFVVHLIAALVLSNLKPWYQRQTRVFQRAVMLMSWYWLPMLIAFAVGLLL